MKKYLSLFFLMVLTINLVAQDINVSFKTSDAGTLIDRVQATNLTTNNTVTLLGNETLTLVNSTSGVSSVQKMKGSIFPNPCNGSATLQFATSTDDDAIIQIVNASGQLVMKKKQTLSPGTHSYSVKFPGSGIYIVLSRTSNGVLSFREVSTNTEMQSPSLEYSGSASLVHTEKVGVNYKSTTTGKTLNYSTGNNIMYTLYSGKNIRVIVDQPTASKTFDVAFYECIDKDGRSYKTVTIGTQTWMAENLAYLPSVNKTSEYSYTASQYYVYDYNGNSISIAKVSNYYKTYGVLYNWPAALNACPAGWHLPSEAEWTILSNYLGGKSIAGGKLKTATGWKSPNTGATNETGFSALPGGYFDNGSFGLAGSGGNWWSSTESNGNTAWLSTLSSAYSVIAKLDYSKSLGLSVRCIKDVSVAAGLPLINTDAVPYISGTTATGGGNITDDGGNDITARGVCWNTTGNPTISDSKTENGVGTGAFTAGLSSLTANTTYYVRAYATNNKGTGYGSQVSFKTSGGGCTTGTFTDSRDGHTYKTVQIGSQTWMAENLAYLPYTTPTSTYSDSEPCYYVYDYTTYGVLYNWTAALTACPAGWHLPSDAEWATLLGYLGGMGVAGGKMKATTGWESPNTGATNESCFSALPGGHYYYSNGIGDSGYSGEWWGSTEYGDAAWSRSLYYDISGSGRYSSSKRYGYSVRCIKD